MKLASSVLMFYSKELDRLFLANIKTNETIQIKGKIAKAIYQDLTTSKRHNIDLSELVTMGFIDDK